MEPHERTRKPEDRDVNRIEWLAVAAGAIYMIALGWAMQSLSYDLWGAMIVLPVLVLVSAPLIRRAFQGELAALQPIVWMGLFAKFAGSVAGSVGSPSASRRLRW